MSIVLLGWLGMLLVTFLATAIILRKDHARLGELVRGCSTL
jgi:hypothetical protein